MNILIEPSKLNGTVRLPSAKSIIQRAVLCAAFAEGTSVIDAYTVSDDVDAAVRCAETFGAAVEAADGTLRVSGGKYAEASAGRKVFRCGDSAAVFRMTVPAAVCLFDECEFRLGDSLYSRPEGPFTELFRRNGIEYSFNDAERSLITRGKLNGNELRIDGSVSSQFVSGVLLALPFCSPGAVLRTENFSQSLGYAEMTLHIMKTAGIEFEISGDCYHVKQGRYRNFRITAEPDMSHAALWQASAFAGNSVRIADMPSRSLQPDGDFFRVFMPALKQEGTVSADISQNPDLAPAIAAAACFRNGETVIENCSRLIYKESDRIALICETLNRFGLRTRHSRDEIVIYGTGSVTGCETDCGNDHRIAMMAAVIAAAADSRSVLKNAECVNKSYPGFFRDFNAVGGKAYEF